MSDLAGRDGRLPTLLPVHAATRLATASGRGPDLARAQKLVTASGTRGEKCVFWTGDRPVRARQLGDLAAATLRQLGYRASLKIHRATTDYFNVIANSRTRAQAGFFGWVIGLSRRIERSHAVHLPRFPTASKNNVNDSEFCNPRVDQAVIRALAQQTIAAQAASNATWAGGRSPGHGPRRLGAAREPEVGRGRLPTRRQRPVESAVGRADRPDLGQVELSKNSATVSAPGSHTPRAASPT